MVCYASETLMSEVLILDRMEGFGFTSDFALFCEFAKICQRDWKITLTKPWHLYPVISVEIILNIGSLYTLHCWIVARTLKLIRIEWGFVLETSTIASLGRKVVQIRPRPSFITGVIISDTAVVKAPSHPITCSQEGDTVALKVGPVEHRGCTDLHSETLRRQNGRVDRLRAFYHPEHLWQTGLWWCGTRISFQVRRT